MLKKNSFVIVFPLNSISFSPDSLQPARKVACYLPKSWVPWDVANPFELVRLSERDPAYAAVAENFFITLDRSKRIIDSIYRVQNDTLWSAFCK